MGGEQQHHVMSEQPGGVSSPRDPLDTTTFHGHEFGGVPGSIGMMLGLPVGVYALTWAVGKPTLRQVLQDLIPALGKATEGLLANAAKGTVIVSAWMAFQAGLERILPGRVVEGTPLPAKPSGRLKYTMNAHAAFWVSVIVSIVLHLRRKSGAGLSRIYDLYPALRHGSIAFAAALSLWLYKHSFNKTDQPETGKLIAGGGKSPSAVYNFFIGRELNPRIGSFDLKVFCELRPGLIGWALINAGMAAKQYDRF